jgi:galactose mutarotase-like enzyme
MAETVNIANECLSAVIAAAGAELQSLVPRGGEELIWQGDSAVWPWHAPNLFPIVGALADDTLVHGGRRYPMARHGFLRQSRCELVEAAADRCAFRLVDDERTRAQYPFAFALVVRYRLAGDRLEQTFELANPGERPLHASLGAHPAFRWPLASGSARPAHRVVFAQAEPAPIRRLAGPLLDPTPQPSPVKGRVLELDDALFEADALIFDRLRSRSLLFGAPDGPAIELAFPDFPHLGIWTKPGGAPFLCLEPWQGHASPVGFTGELALKPGIATLAPGERRSWRLAIRALGRLPSDTV